MQIQAGLRDPMEMPLQQELLSKQAAQILTHLALSLAMAGPPRLGQVSRRPPERARQGLQMRLRVMQLRLTLQLESL